MKPIYDPERHAAYCRHVRDSLTQYYGNTDLPANLQDLVDRFTDLDLSKADQIMRDRYSKFSPAPHRLFHTSPRFNHVTIRCSIVLYLHLTYILALYSLYCVKWFEIPRDYVTRYDTLTGETIPLHQRVGLLDSKLREVTANTEDEQTWVEWVMHAYESTYGYEYQGDSLLIARVNMVMTFIEYYEATWKCTPDNVILRKVANVVAWNLWQMDGLTGRTPTTLVPAPTQRQMSLFEDESEDTASSMEHVECRIFDWRANESQKWSELG